MAALPHHAGSTLLLLLTTDDPCPMNPTAANHPHIQATTPPGVQTASALPSASDQSGSLLADGGTGLTIRKLEIDLSQGFDRHWHGGDAFLSQFHNALSMSFPVGEQSFIDAVRESAALLPHTPDHALLHKTVAQFIGQEATHRYVHGLYNAQLEQQGLVNRW